MYTDAGIKLWLSGRRGSTAQPDGYARDLKLAFSSLLKKVFEVSLWATLIQDPSARRTKDSQPSGFGFEYCASHVRFRVFQQTAIGNLGAPRCYPRAQIRQGADRVSAPTRRVTPRRAEACHQHHLTGWRL